MNKGEDSNNCTVSELEMMDVGVSFSDPIYEETREAECKIWWMW